MTQRADNGIPASPSPGQSEAARIVRDSDATVFMNADVKGGARSRENLARAIEGRPLLGRRGVWLCCADCGLPYSDAGWADFVVSPATWAKLTEDDEASVLCAICMVRRAVRLGIEDHDARFTSGPFAALSASAAPWTCAARKNATPEPQDCNWPFCGCDPHAQKVIDALDECGFLLKPLRESASAAPEVGEGNIMVANKLKATKSCCTVCDAKKVCHICGEQTLLACSDCQINLAATVYVCGKVDCRREHERRCSGSPQPATQPAPGMVCVPVEPTLAMQDAGREANDKYATEIAPCSAFRAIDTWRAMLAAALASQAKGME